MIRGGEKIVNKEETGGRKAKGVREAAAKVRE